MIMSAYNYDIVLVVFGLCLRFVFSNAHSLNVHSDRDCDLKSCPGPLWYYKEIGCTPIFENATSCCPTRYNCDVWETSPRNTCPINDRVYHDGEDIETEEVSDPCMFCSCNGDHISCNMAMCSGTWEPPASDGSPLMISWPTSPLAYCCNSDGLVRRDIERKPSWCENVLKSSSRVRAHCVPIYAHDKAPQTDCNDDLQCPNGNENYVMERPKGMNASTSVASDSENPDKRCKFGELTMRIGEEFGSSNSQGTYRCLCEIPPVPTCRFSAVTDKST